MCYENEEEGDVWMQLKEAVLRLVSFTRLLLLVLFSDIFIFDLLDD